MATQLPRAAIVAAKPVRANDSSKGEKIVNLGDLGLIGIQIPDVDADKRFYDRYKPAVYLTDHSPADTIYTYIFRRPPDCQILEEGYEALTGDLVIADDSGLIDLTGSLHLAPEFPAELLTVRAPTPPGEDQYTAVPLEMKSLDQWVLWRYEVRDEAKKPSKVPYQPNGVHAKSNTPSTWSSFEAVSAALELGGFSGIGFCLSEGDGLSGIDLDGCYDPVSGAFTKPEAQEIVQHALAIGAYVEISPSGTGFRIFVQGSHPRSGKGKGTLNWIEGYDHKSPRFLTVTGNLFPGSGEIVEAQPFLDWFHERYLQVPKAEIKRSQHRIEATEVDDDVLLSEIRCSPKDGPRFTQLFDNGVHVDSATGEVKDDKSAADFALCGLLARRTERNPIQMDRIFRRSALMRDKWDEVRGSKTYGDITIEKAISGCDQTRQEWIAEQEARRVGAFDDELSFARTILTAGDRAQIVSHDFAVRVKQLQVTDHKRAEIFWIEELKPALTRLKPSGWADFKRLMNAVELAPGSSSRVDYIEEINQRFVIVDGDSINKTGVYEFTRNEKGQQVIRCRTKEEVVVSLADKPVNCEDWLASPRRRVAQKIRFLPPPMHVPEGTINSWPGFTCDPIDGATPLLDELVHNVIANGDGLLAEYLWDWWAYKYQNLDTKLLPVIVISGDEGTGKTKYVQCMSSMLGCASFVIQSPGQLKGEFNAFMETSVLIYIAESSWAGDNELKEKLKTLITEGETMVRKMRTDGYMGNNYCSFVITSNNPWAVPAGKGARRYVMIEAGNSRKQDTGFFKALDREMNSGGREALLHRLLTRDVSGFDPNYRPKTGAGWQTMLHEDHNLMYLHQLLSRDSDEEWFPYNCSKEKSRHELDCLSRRTLSLSLSGFRRVPRGHLKADAEDWAAQQNRQRKFIRLSPDGFPGLMRDVFGDDATGKRAGKDFQKMSFNASPGQDFNFPFKERGYELPPLPIAQEAFAAYLGANVEDVFAESRAFEGEDDWASSEELRAKELAAISQHKNLNIVSDALKLELEITRMQERLTELKSREEGTFSTV